MPNTDNTNQAHAKAFSVTCAIPERAYTCHARATAVQAFTSVSMRAVLSLPTAAKKNTTLTLD